MCPNCTTSPSSLTAPITFTQLLDISLGIWGEDSASTRWLNGLIQKVGGTATIEMSMHELILTLAFMNESHTTKAE
jgi:hypothetical protein